jgi:hypothetical protein
MKIPAAEHPAPGKPRKRPRRYDIHLVLAKDEYERLQAIATEDDRALSNLVRRIVRQWLDVGH